MVQLEAQISSRQQQLKEYVAMERYKEAAEERDAIDLLQLKVRSYGVLQNQARKSKILYQPGAAMFHMLGASGLAFRSSCVAQLELHEG